MESKKTNGLGIASIVIGIVALVTSCCYGGFLGVIGGILAIVALTKKDSKKGQAIAGLVTSIIGFLITLVCLIIGASFMSAVGNYDSTTETTNIDTTYDDSTTDSNNTEADTTEAEVKTYKVGDVIDADTFKMTFVSSEDYTSDNEYMQPADGNKYIKLVFDFENTGDSDFLVSDWDFNCYADGYVVESTYLDTDNMLSATISPGKKASGSIFYEVPISAETIELEYETNFWTEDKIVFEVE